MKCIICDNDFEPTHNRHLKYCSKECMSKGLNNNKRRLYAENSKNEKDKALISSWKYRIKTTYGITPEDYYKLFKSQNGRCAICGQIETIRNRGNNISRLSIDHDHKTGKIRGLLCHACNRGLSCFKDNSFRLIKAIKYLKV